MGRHVLKKIIFDTLSISFINGKWRKSKQIEIILNQYTNTVLSLESRKMRVL